MLSFVHPLPEDLKSGLHLQKVQEPEYPLLYADAPPYAREVCDVGDTPLSWIGWVFFVHQADQALTHLGDPGLARIGTSAEIEAQFRQHVSARIRHFQQQTTVAPPWFRQMLLMRMGRAPWQEQQQAEETQQQPEQSQQQAEETQQAQQQPEQAQQ